MKSAANSMSIKIKKNWNKYQTQILEFCTLCLKLFAIGYIAVNFKNLKLKLENIFEKSINLFNKVIDSPLGGGVWVVVNVGCIIYLGIYLKEEVKRIFFKKDILLDTVPDDLPDCSRQNAEYGR